MREFRKQKQLQNKGTIPSKDVEFSCANCLNLFTFAYTDVFMKKSGDLEFVPEPECPQ